MEGLAISHLRGLTLEQHLIEAVKICQVSALILINLIIAEVVNELLGQENALQVLMHGLFKLTSIFQTDVVSF